MHPLYCKSVVLKQTGFLKRAKLAVVVLPAVKILYVLLFGKKTQPNKKPHKQKTRTCDNCISWCEQLKTGILVVFLNS